MKPQARPVLVLRPMSGDATDKLSEVRNFIAIATAALVALLVASQLLLPRLAQDRIEDRLTSGGGTADVSVRAFPAARLLFGDGDSITVRAGGLNLSLERRTNVFDKLDGFGKVDLVLHDFRAGPFALHRFDLSRSGSGPYHLVSSGRTTVADLADYGAARIGLPNGPLLRFFAGQALGGNGPIPIRLDMELRSDGGRVVVVSASGTVAGYPTGPLAELITATIAVQL